MKPRKKIDTRATTDWHSTDQRLRAFGFEIFSRRGVPVWVLRRREGNLYLPENDALRFCRDAEEGAIAVVNVGAVS